MKIKRFDSEKKTIFRSNGKVTNEQRILNDFQKNRNKDILISILQALIMILLCVILASIPSMVLHAEEATSDYGELIATGYYHYTTYDRTTQWFIDSDDEYLVFNFLYDEDEDSTYYTTCIVTRDNPISFELTETEVHTGKVNSSETNVTSITNDYFHQITAESGNIYYILSLLGRRAEVGETSYNTITVNSDFELNTTSYGVSGNSLSAFQSYIELYENYRETDTLNYEQSLTITYEDENVQSCVCDWNYKLDGNGNFVLKTYVKEYSDGCLGFSPVFFSNESFTYTVNNASSSGSGSALSHNGVYYIDFGVSTSYPVSAYNFSYYTGELVYFTDDMTITEYLKTEINNGVIDLLSDDYEQPEPTTPTYTYNSALDFAQISASQKVKYTIQKDSDGSWNFITPSEAGIQFHWTNRNDIKNAFVKIDIYGTFYDDMWATSGTYTHISVTGISKSDCAYLLQQSNLVELARQTIGASKGHGLDIDYIYVQSFGEIDGVLSRSRIYKFNSELISDYGNADSEYDEYLPEITSGYSMPTDYELDTTLENPELTEPEVDMADDTTIVTPVDDIEYTQYYDEKAFLKAFTSFYEMLKGMVTTLNQFPTLFATVFSFLPEPIIILIAGGLVCCIFLRFIGR